MRLPLLMSDLDTLTDTRKQHRVIANDIATAHRGEADGLTVTLARHPSRP